MGTGMLRIATRLGRAARVRSSLGAVRLSSHLPPLPKGIPGPMDNPSRGVNQKNAASLGLVRLASVQLKGWLKMHMNDVCDDILRSAAQMDIRTSNTIGLPMRVFRYTVQRSPFVDKHSMEQFEKREYNRIIEFYGSSCVGPDATKMVHFLRYMERVIIPAHAAARAKVTLFSYEQLHPTPPTKATPTGSLGVVTQTATASLAGPQAEAMASRDLKAQIEEAEVAVEANATLEAWQAEAAPTEVVETEETVGAAQTKAVQSDTTAEQANS